jgi:hypothetical protein
MAGDAAFIFETNIASIASEVDEGLNAIAARIRQGVQVQGNATDPFRELTTSLNNVVTRSSQATATLIEDFGRAQIAAKEMGEALSTATAPGGATLSSQALKITEQGLREILAIEKQIAASPLISQVDIAPILNKARQQLVSWQEGLLTEGRQALAAQARDFGTTNTRFLGTATNESFRNRLDAATTPVNTSASATAATDSAAASRQARIDAANEERAKNAEAQTIDETQARQKARDDAARLAELRQAEINARVKAVQDQIDNGTARAVSSRYAAIGTATDSTDTRTVLDRLTGSLERDPDKIAGVLAQDLINTTKIANADAERAVSAEKAAQLNNEVLDKIRAGDVTPVNARGTTFADKTNPGAYYQQVSENQFRAIEADTGTYLTAAAQHQAFLEQEKIASLRYLKSLDEAASGAAGGVGGPGGGGGLFGSFLGGFASRGFGNQGSLDALVGQVGITTKYAALGAALFGVSSAAHDAIKDFSDLTRATAEFNGVVGDNTASDSFINNLQQISQVAGVTTTQALDLATRGVAAFNNEVDARTAGGQASQKQAIGERFANAVIRNSVITNQTPEAATDDITAAGKAFNLTSDSLDRVNNAIAVARQQFGGNAADISQALQLLGDTGQAAGFSLEQFTQVLGLIQARTGESGTAIAGNLQRIFALFSGNAGQNALRNVGIDPQGTIKDQITALAEVFPNLTERQQQQVEASLGGARALRDLLPLLQNNAALQKAFNAALSEGGQADKEVNAELESLGGRLRALSTELKNIAVNVLRTGLPAPFEAALAVAKPFLDTLDRILQTFDSFPAPLRETLSVLAEVAAVYKLIQVARNNPEGNALLRGVSRITGGGAAAVGTDAAAATELATAEARAKVLARSAAVIEVAEAEVAAAENQYAVFLRRLGADAELTLIAGERLAAAETQLATATTALAEVRVAESAGEERAAATGVLGGLRNAGRSIAGNFSGRLGAINAGSAATEGGLLAAGTEAGAAATARQIAATNALAAAEAEYAAALAAARATTAESTTLSAEAVLATKSQVRSTLALEAAQDELAAANLEAAVLARRGSVAGSLAGGGGLARTESLAVDAGAAGNVARFGRLRAGAGVAAEGVGKLTAGIAGFLGPIGLAIVAFTALDSVFNALQGSIKKITDAQQAQDTSNKTTARAGTVDELNNAAAVATAAANAQRKSGFGVFGSLEDATTRRLPGAGGTSGQNAAELQKNAAALTQLANKLDEANARAASNAGAGAFGPRDPDTAYSLDQLKQGLQNLSDAGVSATNQMNTLAQALGGPDGLADQGPGTILPNTGTQLGVSIGSKLYDDAITGLAQYVQSKGNSAKDSRNVATTDIQNFTAFGKEQGKVRSQAVDIVNQYLNQAGVSGGGALSPDQINELAGKLANLYTNSHQGAAGLAKTRASIQKQLAQQLSDLTNPSKYGIKVDQTTSNALQQIALQQSGTANTQQTTLTGDAVLGAQAQLNVLTQAASEASKEGNKVTDVLAIGIKDAQNSLIAATLTRTQGALAVAKSLLAWDDTVGQARSDVETAQAALDAATSTGNLDQINQAQAGLNAAMTAAAQAQAAAAEDFAAHYLNGRLIDPRDAVGAATAQLNSDAIQLQNTPQFGADGQQTSAFTDALAKRAQDQIALVQASIAQTNALNVAHVDPRDSIGAANVAWENAIRSLRADLPGTEQWANDFRAATQAALAVNQAYTDLANAREEAGVFPGSQVEEARSQLDAARRNLRLQLPGTTAYYQALKALHDAQQAVADANRQAASNAFRLTIDLTDPVATARADLRDARRKLAQDRAAGAPGDVTNADTLDVRGKEAAAESAAFSQRISDLQTADQLGRISHATYLQYLQHEHDRLTAISHRTRQQQDELNQVDQLMLTAANALNGQFNIGNIDLPTVYEVRRAIAAGSQFTGLGGYSNSNNTVTINGADFAQVVAYIKQYLGIGTALVSSGARKA